MTYKELSEKTGIKTTTLKRYGRLFLEEDLSCGCQCGVTRKLSDNDAWVLYVAYILYHSGCKSVKKLLAGIPDEGIWKISKFFQIVFLHIDIDLLREEFNSL